MGFKKKTKTEVRLEMSEAVLRAGRSLVPPERTAKLADPLATSA